MGVQASFLSYITEAGQLLFMLNPLYNCQWKGRKSAFDADFWLDALD
jgi:hypothetical protein